MNRTDAPALPAQHRMGEFGHLVSLALPLTAAQLAQVGMGVVDTVMAGRLSAVDLAGVALGGSVLWPVTVVSMGLLQAITPTVAQLNGAGRHEPIGEVIRQGLWIALFSSFLVVAVITHAGP
ncbi:MAG TPA: MATE family efflux transporter, partial [Pseudomonadales bacterium]|nr:MATE family efflux transporter [Pseudomonadales bacterium]